MRLLNVKTLELAEFNESSVPRYIAISHTWDDEELNFADWHKPGRETKPGYAKVRDAARVAKERGHKFIWIDTCCIDKSSSAELSEAINSMYKWYAAADACHVYMSDVHFDASAPDDYDPHLPDNNFPFPSFPTSRWFKRGWTLQELIAPHKVIFFSQEWRTIGFKEGIAAQLSRITGIDANVLRDPSYLPNESVAERMSWASGRDTTRTEDLAYCLLGIFDVNMPLLYGEGERAFIRLQEQIMRETDDQSLFAWADPDAAHDDVYGMLATHPKFFRNSKGYQPLNEIPTPKQYMMTNKGLSISLRIEPSDALPDHFLAPLDCARGRLHDRFAAILLKPVSATVPVYCRVQASKIGFCGGTAEPKKVFVRQNLLQTQKYHISSTIMLKDLSAPVPVRLISAAVPDGLMHAVYQRIASHNLSWAPPRCQTTFGLLRRPRSVAAVLEFYLGGDDFIFLSLGRCKDGTAGYHISTKRRPEIPAQLDFSSRKEPCSAKGHRITVSCQHFEREYDMVRHYLVDIEFVKLQPQKVTKEPRATSPLDAFHQNPGNLQDVREERLG